MVSGQSVLGVPDGFAVGRVEGGLLEVGVGIAVWAWPGPTLLVIAFAGHWMLDKLNTYQLTGGVQAAQDSVGATDFQIGLVTTSGQSGPGVDTWTGYYTLYFPSVNRFVVFEVGYEEN